MQYIEQVKREQNGELIIACYNSPKNNTVPGDANLCDALKVLLDKEGIFARKLNVKNAYHSAHMVEVGDEYLELMRDLSPNGHFLDAKEEIVIFSTVRGRRVVKKRLDGQYWVDHLVSPVRFLDGLLALCKGGYGNMNGALNGISLQQISRVDHIIELGPHAALQSAIKEIVSEELQLPVQYLSVLHRNDTDHTTLLNTVGHLKIRGSPINLARVNGSPYGYTPRTLVSLPPYSSNHSTKVIAESRLSRKYRLRKHPNHDILGTLAADSTPDTAMWRHFIRIDEVPWVTQHNVTNQCVYPGVGFVLMAIEAMRQLADPNILVQSFTLRHISLKRALIVPDTKEGVETCMIITAAEESSMSKSSIWKSFRIRSYNSSSDNWDEHCTGYISINIAAPTGPVDAGRESEAQREIWRQTLESVLDSCRKPIEFNKAYEALDCIGLAYGPRFRNLSHVKASRQGEVTGKITIPDVKSAMPKKFIRPHLIHPTTMDSMLHLFLCAILDLTGRTSLEKPAVPTFIQSLWVAANIPAQAGHSLRG
jgi:acyl transferase domain-containing protein